jgi:hypothetical protein
MSENYHTMLQQAHNDFAQGDPQKAFQTFRPVLSYPGMVKGLAAFTDALHIFSEIGKAIVGENFASLIDSVARNPEKADTLYKLGYELIEQELPDLAATVLTRAFALAPRDEGILTELVTALGKNLRYDEACRLLWAHPLLLKQSFLCRYLLAFNSIMIGDLTTPRALLPALQQSQEKDHLPLSERISGMLGRADVLSGTSPLDNRDLRGWHFVLTGGLLLHLSPHGFDEGMYGRYAFVQDSPALCMEGIQRLKTVFDVLQLNIPRIYVLPDRSSAILAHAIAQIFHCPLVSWPDEGSTEKGLIVAYDLGELDNELLITLSKHQPGQILWSHATCWTRAFPFTADLTTFQYQINKSPWGERMTIDRQSGKVIMSPLDDRATEVLASEIIQTELPPDTLTDLPHLQKFAQATATITNDDATAGLFRSHGNRRKQWEGSPVFSSHFL